MTPMMPPYAQQPQHGTPNPQHHVPNGVMNRPMSGMPMTGFPSGMQHMGGNPGMMQMNPHAMNPAMMNQHGQTMMNMNMAQVSSYPVAFVFG